MTPNTAGSRVLIRAAYVAQYPDPVAFRAGETVEVEVDGRRRVLPIAGIRKAHLAPH